MWRGIVEWVFSEVSVTHSFETSGNTHQRPSVLSQKIRVFDHFAVRTSMTANFCEIMLNEFRIRPQLAQQWGHMQPNAMAFKRLFLSGKTIIRPWNGPPRVLLHPVQFINPLKPELIPICYLLTLLGDHHFLHVSRIRVKLLTFRLLMSYIYGALILDVSRSHTTTQLSR